MDLIAICMGRLLALTDDGHEFPITNLFDAHGEETEHLDEAVQFVAGPDADGKWWRGAVDDFGGVRH